MANANAAADGTHTVRLISITTLARPHHTIARNPELVSSTNALVSSWGSLSLRTHGVESAHVFSDLRCLKPQSYSLSLIDTLSGPVTRPFDLFGGVIVRQTETADIPDLPALSASNWCIVFDRI